MNTRVAAGGPASTAGARPDLALVGALLEIEEERSQRGFGALERLLAVLPPGGSGPLDERVLALPSFAFGVAAMALYELGWLYDAPPSCGGA